MSLLIEKLNSLLSTGWKITRITFQQAYPPKSQATVTKIEGKGIEVVVPLDDSKVTVRLSNDSREEVIETEEDEDFKWLVMHYKTLPNLLTGELEATYVENSDRYHDFEGNFFEFTCGIKPFLTMREAKGTPKEIDCKRILAAIST